MHLSDLALRMSALVATAASLSAQTPNPAISFDGGNVPAGATSATYDAFDSDGIWGSDQMIAGRPCTVNSDGWSTGNLPLECQNGDVVGGAGSSGEVCCTVYVVITFRNAAGQVVGTFTTGVKNTCCPADPE